MRPKGLAQAGLTRMLFGLPYLGVRGRESVCSRSPLMSTLLV